MKIIKNYLIMKNIRKIKKTVLGKSVNEHKEIQNCDQLDFPDISPTNKDLISQVQTPKKSFILDDFDIESSSDHQADHHNRSNLKLLKDFNKVFDRVLFDKKKIQTKINSKLKIKSKTKIKIPQVDEIRRSPKVHTELYNFNVKPNSERLEKSVLENKKTYRNRIIMDPSIVQFGSMKPLNCIETSTK